MKKRIVIAMVTGLVIASLAGCGTQADATNQSPESSSAVESEAGTASEAEENTEDTEDTEDTGETDTNESMSTEIIGDNAKESSDFSGAENEDIVLYAEIASYGDYEGQKDKDFDSVDNILVAKEDVPVFNGDGIEVGYIKTGSTVAVTEYGHNAWARFENPIAEADYDYLYVLKKYVTDRKDFMLTTQEAESLIKELIGHPDVYTFTEKTDDMEVCEFMIPMYYDETESPSDTLFFILRDSCDEVWPHHTLAVVCTEDIDDYILCQIYYKD